MESLHTPTIQLTTTIVSFSSTMVMLLIWRSNTGVKGLGYWTTTIAMFGVGFLLLSQVNKIHPLFSFVLSCGLITGGFTLYYRGVRHFLNAQPKAWLEYSCVITIAIAFVIFTFVYPHLGLRALCLAAVLGLISTVIALELWGQRKMPWGVAALSVAAIFAFVALLMLIRILVIAGDINAYSFATNQSVPILNLFFMIVQISLTFTTLYLANTVLSNQLRVQADKLEQSNVALTEFAYIVSHDLKEPLRTITSYAELLQQSNDSKLGELGEVGLSFIHDAATRMHQLIEGLLQHSRIGQDMDTTTIETNQLITHVLEDLTIILNESDGSVTASPLPAISANETDIRLLFQNLIANALKFQQPDNAPFIKIAAQREANFWQFSIQDNGIGIDPTQHGKLFKIFSRLHARSEYEGTGIGLAHCRKIVERYGGRIWVDSKLGHGSTFFFTIPA